MAGVFARLTGKLRHIAGAVTRRRNVEPIPEPLNVEPVPEPLPDFVEPVTRRVLREFVAGVPAEYREGLAAQVAAIDGTTFEWTVVGFYANFTFDKNDATPMPDLALASPIGITAPLTNIPPPFNVASFLLWFKDGYIDFLEGYSYGDRFPQMDPDKAEYYFETETYEAHRKMKMERQAQ